MKKLFFILVIGTTIFGCSNVNEPNYSVLEPLLGEWKLQDRVLNGTTPVDIENERLFFSEDNDIEDTKGFFALDATNASSGLFYISFPDYNLIFDDNNGESLTYDFALNTLTLELVRRNDDGDLVSEVWTRTTNQDED